MQIYCYLYIPVRLHDFQRKTLDQLDKDDQIKLLDNKSKKITKTGNRRISKLVMHFDTLDQGTEAFMQWLGSDDKMSASSNPIILKQFVRNRYTILYDSTLGHDVIVEQYFLNRNTKMTVLYWINNDVMKRRLIQKSSRLSYLY